MQRRESVWSNPPPPRNFRQLLSETVCSIVRIIAFPKQAYGSSSMLI